MAQEPAFSAGYFLPQQQQSSHSSPYGLLRLVLGPWALCVLTSSSPQFAPYPTPGCYSQRGWTDPSPWCGGGGWPAWTPVLGLRPQSRTHYLGHLGPTGWGTGCDESPCQLGISLSLHPRLLWGAKVPVCSCLSPWPTMPGQPSTEQGTDGSSAEFYQGGSGRDLAKVPESSSHGPGIFFFVCVIPSPQFLIYLYERQTAHPLVYFSDAHTKLRLGQLGAGHAVPCG